MTRKTMGVLGGCYLKSPTLLRGQPLTHRAEVSADGGWPMPLCSRVRLGSLTDDGTQHTDARPTCPACGRIWDREGQYPRQGVE